MRVAEDISNTINAYLAFRGALIVMRNNNIEAVSTPLFCTGAGCMSTIKACIQMKKAYISVINNEFIGKDWLFLHSNHRQLYSAS